MSSDKETMGSRDQDEGELWAVFAAPTDWEMPRMGGFNKIRLRRSEESGHEPTIDQMELNEVVVNTADDCFYKNVDGVIVKYTRS